MIWAIRRPPQLTHPTPLRLCCLLGLTVAKRPRPLLGTKQPLRRFFCSCITIQGLLVVTLHLLGIPTLHHLRQRHRHPAIRRVIPWCRANSLKPVCQGFRWKPVCLASKRRVGSALYLVYCFQLHHDPRVFTDFPFWHTSEIPHRQTTCGIISRTVLHLFVNVFFQGHIVDLSRV